MTYLVYIWPRYNPEFKGSKDECKEFLSTIPASYLPYAHVENEDGDIVYQPYKENV